MAKVGRPSSWEYDAMRRFGATDEEMALIEAEDFGEWELAYLVHYFIRQDRSGFIASRKKQRSVQRKRLYHSSPAHRIRNAMTARMSAALRGRSDGALFSRLPYTREQLMAHLEVQFRDGMTWDNYGKWHVDHIKPCAMFDQTDPTQFAECWALANLAPLWASENMKKGAKYGPA